MFQSCGIPLANIITSALCLRKLEKAVPSLHQGRSTLTHDFPISVKVDTCWSCDSNGAFYKKRSSACQLIPLFFRFLDITSHLIVAAHPFLPETVNGSVCQHFRDGAIHRILQGAVSLVHSRR